jgi:hypothetical protein
MVSSSKKMVSNMFQAVGEKLIEHSCGHARRADEWLGAGTHRHQLTVLTRLLLSILRQRKNLISPNWKSQSASDVDDSADAEDEHARPQPICNFDKRFGV